MDVLSDVLRAVRMTGGFFFHNESYAPWVCGEPMATQICRRVMPDADFIIPFHVVLEGQCWVDVEGETPTAMQLVAGDIVVFPKGDPHFMTSDLGMRKFINPADFDPPPGRKQSLRFMQNGEPGGPVACRFICGFIGCDNRPFNPLLGALPRMFRTTTSETNREWLASLAWAGVAESERDGIGGQTMLARLAELMFVEVIRQRVAETHEDARNWLAGLRDPHVGAALEIVHSRPSEAWTLESLAREIGLSRSVFAARFSELVGMPAMQYLARWRMTLAAHLMEDTGISVAQAGTEVAMNLKRRSSEPSRSSSVRPPAPGARRRSGRAFRPRASSAERSSLRGHSVGAPALSRQCRRR